MLRQITQTLKRYYIFTFIPLLLLTGCGLFPTDYTEPKDDPYSSLKYKPGATSRSDIHQTLGEPFFVNNQWRVEVFKNAGTIKAGIIALVPPVKTAHEAGKYYYAVVTYDNEWYLSGMSYDYSGHIRGPHDYYFVPPGTLYAPLKESKKIAHTLARQGECVVFFRHGWGVGYAYIDDDLMGQIFSGSIYDQNNFLIKTLKPGSHILRYDDSYNSSYSPSFKREFTCKSGETVYIYAARPFKKIVVRNKAPRDLFDRRFVISNDKLKLGECKAGCMDKLRERAMDNDAEAQLNLYYAERPNRSSLKWLCRAADQGRRYAQAELAGQYARGTRMVEQDRVWAYVWYSLAIQGGGKEFRSRLTDLTTAMTMEQIEEAERRLNSWQPGQCEHDLSPAHSGN